MILRGQTRWRRRLPHGAHPAGAEAARRATRARDHLERKRAQERRRRQRERWRAENPQHREQLRGALSPFVFALALGIGLVSARPLAEFFWLRSTSLESVAVQGARLLSPEAIVRGAGIAEGSSVAAIDPAEIVRSVETDPWIESARALRLPSGALVISIVERGAIARWRFDPQAEPLLIDPHGKRFAGALEPASALPLVNGHGSGNALPTEVVEILAEIERHAVLVQNPATLILHLPGVQAASEAALLGSQTGYVLQLGADGPRALLGRRLFSERVARLAALVESDEPTLRHARLIDLRYADRAVLRTEPASG
jgi:cell division septal protein FtsQ